MDGPRITRPPGPSIAASNTTYNTGTVVISGGANITVGTDAGNLITISGGAGGGGGGSFSAGVSNLGNTSGNTGTVSNRLVLAGGNNVTVSQSTNAGGATITISGVNTVAQSGTQFSAGISGGNTSGDTGTVAGRLVLAGGNNITLSGSTNGASETITISGGAGAGGFAGGGISGGNTSGDTGTVTGRLVFAGNNNVTLSGSTNAGSMTISISVPNTASYDFEAGLSNIGNTSGNTGVKTDRLVLAGGNNITLSGSTDGGSATITVSGPNTAAQTGTQFSAGISNLGNTAGDTGVKAARLVLVGTDNITLSGSTNGESATVSIKGAAGGGGGNFSGGVSNLGNTAGSTGVTGTRLVFVGVDDVTLSQSTDANGGTISILGGPTIAMTGGANGIAASMQGIDNASIIVRPLMLDAYLTAHTAVLPMSAAGASGSTAGVSWGLGIYTKNVSTLSLATSCSSTSSWSSGTNATSNWAGVSGIRQWPITNQTWNFTPGDYIVAMWVRSTNAGTYNHMADSGPGSAFSGWLGSSANVSQLIKPYWGKFSASTAGPLPNSMAISQLANTLNGANERMPDYIFYNSSFMVT